MHQSRDTKQSIATGLLLCLNNILKGSHSTPKKQRESCNSSFYSSFCVLSHSQSILYRESLQNWQFLFCSQTVGEKHESPLDNIIIMDNIFPIASFAFYELFYDCAKFQLFIGKYTIINIFYTNLPHFYTMVTKKI